MRRCLPQQKKLKVKECSDSHCNGRAKGKKGKNGFRHSFAYADWGFLLLGWFVFLHHLVLSKEINEVILLSSVLRMLANEPELVTIRDSRCSPCFAPKQKK